MVESKSRGMPEKRSQGCGVVCGEQYSNLYILQLAAQGVSSSDWASGSMLRWSAGHSTSRKGNCNNSNPWYLYRDPLWGRYSHDSGHSPGIECMLNDFNCSCPVYIACGYTDLRRGIDGLASMVSTQFQMDPFQTALFILRTPPGSHQGVILGGRWLSVVVQATRKRQLSMAPYERRSPCIDSTTVSLAHGRTENRTAESQQASNRVKHDMMQQMFWKSIYLCRFMV